MKSTILLFAIFVYGILISDLLIIGLTIPYFILMMMVAYVIGYAKANYPKALYSIMLKKEISKTFNNGKMFIYVVFCKATYASSILYTAYVLFEKYYGVIK